MHEIVIPQQTGLFDLFDSVLTPKTGKCPFGGWTGVFHAIYLKIVGWNVLRALLYAKMRQIVCARANMTLLGFHFAFLRMTIAAESGCMEVKRPFLLDFRGFEELAKLSKTT